MAKQNFLAGGFYGKLGEIVGQRWKNKRTLRVYVKTPNPNTKAQRVTRKDFGECTKFAQMGAAANYKTPVFSDENLTEWMYRMSTARKLSANGAQGLARIPLYPVDFVPPYQIDAVTYKGLDGSNFATFSLSGTLPENARTLSMWVAFYDDNNVFLGYQLFNGAFTVDSPINFSFPFVSSYAFNENCKCRICSTDDVEVTTAFVGSDVITVKIDSGQTYEFNTAITSITVNSSGIYITFAQLWKGNDCLAGGVTIPCIRALGNQIISASAPTLQDSGGYCRLFVPFSNDGQWGMPAFVGGESFVFSYLMITDGNDVWEITNASVTNSIVSNVRSLSVHGASIQYLIADGDSGQVYFENIGTENSTDEEIVDITLSGSIRCTVDTYRYTCTPTAVIFGYNEYQDVVVIDCEVDPEATFDETGVGIDVVSPVEFSHLGVTWRIPAGTYPAT